MPLNCDYNENILFKLDPRDSLSNSINVSLKNSW